MNKENKAQCSGMHRDRCGKVLKKRAGKDFEETKE